MNMDIKLWIMMIIDIEVLMIISYKPYGSKYLLRMEV